MATWTSIPDSNLEPDKPIRSVDGLALRDNPVAIAEGAAGAPRIDGTTGPAVQRAGLDNNIINRAKVNTNTASTSGTISNGAQQNITLNRMAFFPMLQVEDRDTGTSITDVHMEPHTNAGAATSPRFSLNNQSGTTAEYDIRHEYIAA